MSERQRLPDTIALFPLRDATLLPRARLPLNIFEPRYLSMTEHALGHGRLIGMVRPRHDSDEMNPPLYEVGCAGRITSFSETDDGRYLIELVGVSRFHLDSEMLADGGFRMGEVDWTPFESDLDTPDADVASLRTGVIERLAAYLESVGLTADWKTIDGASTETIVNSVSMSCPFDPDEKQALLEAPDIESRIRVLMTLMDMALAEPDDSDGNDGSSRMQ